MENQSNTPKRTTSPIISNKQDSPAPVSYDFWCFHSTALKNVLVAKRPYVAVSTADCNHWKEYRPICQPTGEETMKSKVIRHEAPGVCKQSKELAAFHEDRIFLAPVSAQCEFTLCSNRRSAEVL